MSLFDPFTRGPRQALPKWNGVLDAFRKGIIIDSEDFAAQPQPDGRVKLSLRNHSTSVSRGTSSGPPKRSLINQIVIELHASDETFTPTVTLALDTTQLASAANMLGSNVAGASWDVRFLDPDHPYSSRILLGTWFGGVGFALYADSINAFFPGLASLEFTLGGSDPSLTWTLQVYKGGHNGHTAGDVENLTGELLQSLIAATGATVTYDFAAQTVAL